MKIVLASCSDLPSWEVDDRALHTALERQGVAFEVRPWDASIDWSQFALCLVRTTWDYASRISDFRQWIRTVSTQTRLYNSAELMLWNLNKRYLLDLQRAGIPIAPSVWIDERVCLEEVMLQREWSRGFLKPVVGASASDTLRFSLDEVERAQLFLDALVPSKEMILQPYISTVETQGEFSAIYIAGSLSHCVQKIPVEGDYRVQDDYGASDRAIAPISALVELSENCFSALSREWIYARVDALQMDDGRWVLNELEMVEPSLFFRHSKTAAERLAGEIAHLLRSIAREESKPQEFR